ncbi:class I SAM-dependent methyltransferase [Dictyobacter formicarum]|uniref:class I SAM-dependent methyltransferase n=1 Tax=Dictyobacter formicarum TaxID=2778368 RepID=UPI00357179C2
MHEENRRSWNEATRAHNSHRGDQVAFFRNGGTTLHPEELELLGDIRGRSVVHLQCNAGQDTLSLVRLGAIVTGVDISDTAIDFARTLSQQTGIAATFVRSDLYEWFQETAASQQRFDRAFCSYGAICWLSDIKTWAKGVAAILRPGGSLIVIDRHPVSRMFDWDGRRTSPYTTRGEALSFEDGVGDYVAAGGQGLPGGEYVSGIQDFVNPNRHHEFSWGLGDIVTAVLDSNLTLTSLREYLYINDAPPFAGMVDSEGHWSLPPDQPNMPQMFSLTARK